MKRMDKGTTFLFVNVPSVDEFLKKIVKAGGKIVTEKTAIPGVGYSAYVKDMLKEPSLGSPKKILKQNGNRVVSWRRLSHIAG